MDFSEEAIREERERLSFNHPGFNYPLMHRWIKKNDTLEMARVIRRSAHHLKGFINWAQYAPRWDFKQIQRVLSARSCGYCHQVLKVTPTLRKLNIVDIVLQLSLRRVRVEITVTASFSAVRDVNIEGEPLAHATSSPFRSLHQH
jgi:hypothetical protein